MESLALINKLEDVVKKITASRLQFQHFFDAYIDDIGSFPHIMNFHHGVMYTLEQAQKADIYTPNPASNSGAFTLALCALGKAEEISHALASALATGLFGSSIDQKILQNNIASALGVERLTSKFQSDTEARTDPNITWTDPGHMLPAMILAHRRICRIVVRDFRGKQMAKGTGFLVGPSAILTNWHVVKDMPAPDKNWKIKVYFDYSVATGLKLDDVIPTKAVKTDWLIANSLTGSLGPSGDKSNWWMDAGQYESWQNDVKDKLDFALIKLESAPGFQRGWYDLNKLGKPEIDGTCWILHHPSGFHQTITSGTFYNTPEHAQTRLFHTASTVPGSSGGLVLDDKGRPVALHHLGLVNEDIAARDRRPPNGVMNVAIKLASIKDKISDDIYKSIVTSNNIRPVGGCLDGRHPVFGRTHLIDNLTDLKSGIKPILKVHVAHGINFKQPGKSFTGRIIESLFPHPENVHLVLFADELKSNALDMAEQLADGFGLAKVDHFAQQSDTTLDAYTINLVNQLRSLMQHTSTKELCFWLIIDNLDVHHLPDAGGRTFLNRLYSRIRLIPNLRIVLIGLKDDIGSIRNEDLMTEEIFSSDEELRHHFNNWLKERGRDATLNQESQELITETLMSYKKGESPISDLAQFVDQHLAKAFDKVFNTLENPPISEDNDD